MSDSTPSAADLPSIDWDTWQPTIRATLMFVVRGDEVLLIRKKRGFGMGKVNGPGGKLDPGETELDCAVRETQEELGITALNPVKRGELWFHFVDGLAMHVAVFQAMEHEGEAVETGKHTVELKKQGSGPVYYCAYLTNFTLEDPITKAGLESKVQRWLA